VGSGRVTLLGDAACPMFNAYVEKHGSARRSCLKYLAESCDDLRDEGEAS
jgi:hypothetical protein